MKGNVHKKLDNFVGPKFFFVFDIEITLKFICMVFQLCLSLKILIHLCGVLEGENLIMYLIPFLDERTISNTSQGRRAIFLAESIFPLSSYTYNMKNIVVTQSFFMNKIFQKYRV